jgi:hypothetical protein
MQLTAGKYPLPLPQVDSHLENRSTYIEGYFVDEVDLSIYDKITDTDNE